MYLEFEEWFQFEHGSMVTNKKLISKLQRVPFTAIREPIADNLWR